MKRKPGMMSHTYGFSTQEAEVEGLRLALDIK